MFESVDVVDDVASGPSAEDVARWAGRDAWVDQQIVSAGVGAGMLPEKLWQALARLTAAQAVPGAEQHLPRVSEADRVDRVKAWSKVLAHATAMLMTEIGAVAAERDADPTYTGSDAIAYLEFLPVEIALALSRSRRSAQYLVDDATSLTGRLPATLAALQAGRIDAATAHAIVAETDAITDPAVLQEVEAAALDKARQGRTARSVRIFTRAEALRRDPAAAKARQDAAEADTGVVKGDLVDGVGSLTATLTAADRAAVWTTLTDHARALKNLPGEDRSMTQLRGAALVDLLTRPWLYAHDAGHPVVVDPTRDHQGNPLTLHTCTGPTTETTSTHKPTPSRRWKTDVIVNLSTLLGIDDDPAILVGHGLVPADTARHLAADSTWRRLVTDPLTGTVIERSTTRYRPPTSLVDQITARDQHCQMPGCRQPAHDCDIDHRNPYHHGGTTCACNLWPLCRYHHRCKHSPGWHLQRQPDGTIHVTTPTGHTYTAPPPTPWD